VLSFRSLFTSFLLALASCLIGGCEKRGAAQAGELEESSASQSSLRASDEAFRGESRRERTPIHDVLQVIRRLPHLDFSAENGFGGNADYAALMRAEEAIKTADPAQFEAIMEEIGKLEDSITRSDLQAFAIFHLMAGQDLLRAGEMVLDRFPSGDERWGVLNSLVTGTHPRASDCLDFWRSLPGDDQSEVSDYVFMHAAVDLGSEGLVRWKDQGYQLNENETFRLMEAMARLHTATAATPRSAEEASEYPDLIGAILPLEKNGVLSKGAADELLLQSLIHQAELGEERFDFIGMPGTQARVEELRKDGFDSLYSRIAAERPHRFFTDIGLHDLQEEKVTVAWKGWLDADPVAAREWFGEQGPELAPSERDSIRAGFASHALGQGNGEAARAWGSQISDPELRRKTLSGLPRGD